MVESPNRDAIYFIDGAIIRENLYVGSEEYRLLSQKVSGTVFAIVGMEI